MPSFSSMLLQALNLAFAAIWWLVLAYVVISWLPVRRWHPVVRFINRAVEPMLKPFRVVIPMGGAGLDISPIIFLLVLGVVRQVLANLIQ